MFGDMDNFDRQFNLMRRIFWIVFVLVAIGIIATVVLQVAGIVYVFNNPEKTGEFGGKIIKGIMDGVTNH